MLQDLVRHNITSWIVAGSGVASAIDAANLRVLDEVPYTMLPEMPTTTVHGHRPSLLVVEYKNRAVGVFLGRHHLYEGHSTELTCALVRIAHTYGGTHVILTNAAGGLHPLLEVGDIVLLNDGIDFTFQRQVFRARELFNVSWTERTAHRCTASGIAVRSGVYAQVTGPSFETRAEIHMLRRMGADLVGMSTIQEAAYAAHLGMSVLGVSLVTNKASDTTATHLSHLDVLDTAAASVSRLSSVLFAALDCV